MKIRRSPMFTSAKLPIRYLTWLCAAGLSLLTCGYSVAKEPAKSGQPTHESSLTRTPWLNSNLKDAPDPPLPYILEQAYPVEFLAPISFHRIPDTSVFLVLQQNGKILSFNGASDRPTAALVADLNATPPPFSGVQGVANKRVELFSLCFHPNFEQNNHVFVCYVTPGGGTATETHIARFVLAGVDQPNQEAADASMEIAPVLKVDSELNILTCDGGGHNGCTLAFGPDGMLYISIGDLTNPTPPDTLDTGQDISDLYASILRIDVDHVSDDAYQNGNYAIPDDNPFVDLESARGEVYAYGLRNPFRMSFDSLTGDLWVGDVGWEAWEMVYRVRPGGNYGWAIKEGPGDVKDQPPGPTPILAADIALNHAEAASVTGGMVYRGSRHPDLSGSYIFGDWITRKFWSASFDSDSVTSYQEIALSQVKPICFETDADGELLVLDYNAANKAGSIYRFAKNPAYGAPTRNFPQSLSDTGLFRDLESLQTSPGVHRYQINASMWKDGASADYVLGLPDTSQAVFYQRPQTTFDWFKTFVTLPKGAVLAKTYSLGTHPETGKPRRLETQISLKDSRGDWQFFTYGWSRDGRDAELVGAEGESREYEVLAANGEETKIRWSFASRSSCRVCHTPWVGETMAFTESQLRSPSGTNDSWKDLFASGLAICGEGPPPLNDEIYDGMVNPEDMSQPIDRRARSYLHVNCAHCHLFGGNASTNFDISFDKLLQESNILDQPPMRGELGIEAAKVAEAGRPDRSLLLYRIAKTGSGRMPHIGSRQTDPLGVSLIHQWIAQLPQDPEVMHALDLLCAPKTASSPQVGRLEGDRLKAVKSLLASPSACIHLAAAIATGRVDDSLTREIIDESRAAPLPIQDLLEAYAAPDQKIQRLGENIDASLVLNASGSATRGATLFAQGVGTCSGCHRIGEVGKNIGPDLSKIASKLKSKDAILESILWPSKQIEELYQAVSILTYDGRLLVGNILAEDDQHLSLQDANGKRHEVAKDDIEARKQLETSLMPEQLLSALTLQQAADLLAYLASLK